MAKNSQISSAIIVIPKSELMDVFRQVLKQQGISDFVMPNSASNTVKELKAKPDAVLILDWAMGPGEVCKILEETRAPTSTGVRPIFLFSAQATTAGIEGVALEYSVLQVHCGEVSQKTIHEKLGLLFAAEVLPKDVLEKFAEVANARAANQWEEAENILRDLYQRHGTLQRVAVELAENMVHTGNVESALALLEPMLENPRPEPRTLNIFGRLLLKQGKFEQATVYLQKAKLINPFDTNRLIELGNAFLEVDNAKKAKLNFSEALAMDPHSRQAATGMGKSLLLTGEFNDALKFIRDLSGTAEMASVFNTAAVISIRHDRFKDGMILYQQAVKTVGNDPAVLARLAFNVGIGWYRKSELQDAALYFKMAAQLDKTYDKALRNARALEKKLAAPVNFELQKNLVEQFVGQLETAINSTKALSSKPMKDVRQLTELEIDSQMTEEDEKLAG